ncbi:DNA-binding domain-containing protein [Arenimonas sp. MALMAid1274]|uniref:HvfC family RiPP maturation protein n=1 Tax=Arenimonas sp. MALMAid1274 TaxID=3411630 RepID=UPI003BA2CCB5
MPAPETLRAQQFQLAAHIRDPGQAPPPGIEDRRLAIYRDLFYNSLQGLLAGNFPVIRRLLGDTGWHRLVRDFYREFRCGTPLFPELPREFIQYLQQRAQAGRGDAPWLADLAHYEWAELAMDLLEADPAEERFDPDGDLFEGVPLLSPLAWPLAYTWPVHRLSPDYQPAETPAVATFLMVQRDAQHKVRFSELNALTFRLLQRLSDEPALRGREQLQALAMEAGAPDPDAFLAQGRVMLDQLRATHVILGTSLS